MQPLTPEFVQSTRTKIDDFIAISKASDALYMFLLAVDIYAWDRKKCPMLEEKELCTSKGMSQSVKQVVVSYYAVKTAGRGIEMMMKKTK